MALDKKMLAEVGTRFLGAFSKKKIADIKDPEIRNFLGNVWGDIEADLPDLVGSIIGPGEVVMSGEHKEKSAEILGKMKDDILSLKNGEIDKIDFSILMGRRKTALYALYNAQEARQSQPSIQKILNAVGSIAETVLKHGIPYILAAII